MSLSDTLLSQFELRLGESTQLDIDAEPLITKQGLDHVVIQNRAEVTTWDGAIAIVENPTWYEILKIAHDYIEQSKDYDRRYFEGLNPDDSVGASGLPRYTIFLGL